MKTFKMVALPAIMDIILMEMSKCEKLLTDIRMRGGPCSTDHSTGFAPGELKIEDLHDGYCGGHCRYHNKMVLAILNLHVAKMPPTKFDSI